jgi:hypothetical protein
LSAEGLVIEPSASPPVRAIFRPQEAGIGSPLWRENQAQLLPHASCHSVESRFPGRRRIFPIRTLINAEILRFAQDDIPGARARSTAPLTPGGAFRTAFCFERWGLNQAGRSFRGNPTCFKPLSESLLRIYLQRFAAERCEGYPSPPPSFSQSNMLPPLYPECKRNFRRPGQAGPCCISRAYGVARVARVCCAWRCGITAEAYAERGRRPSQGEPRGKTPEGGYSPPLSTLLEREAGAHGYSPPLNPLLAEEGSSKSAAAPQRGELQKLPLLA